MNKHYAIVKCERVQKIWKYNKNSSYYDRYLRHGWNKNDSANLFIKYNTNIIKEDFDHTWGQDEKYYQERIDLLLRSWENEFIDRKVEEDAVRNGQCILWEGEVEQERLRVDDNIFIPTVGKYLPITKVELSPNGEIVYYVEYTKYFDDTKEKFRLQAVEDWIDGEFGSHIESYEELKQYKDSLTEQRQLYQNALEEVEKIRKEHKSQIKVGSKKQNPTPYVRPIENRDESDIQWEQWALFGGLFGLFLLVVFCIILFS